MLPIEHRVYGRRQPLSTGSIARRLEHVPGNRDVFARDVCVFSGGGFARTVMQPSSADIEQPPASTGLSPHSAGRSRRGCRDFYRQRISASHPGGFQGQHCRADKPSPIGKPRPKASLFRRRFSRGAYRRLYRARAGVLRSVSPGAKDAALRTCRKRRCGERKPQKLHPCNASYFSNSNGKAGRSAVE